MLMTIINVNVDNVNNQIVTMLHAHNQNNSLLYWKRSAARLKRWNEYGYFVVHVRNVFVHTFLWQFYGWVKGRLHLLLWASSKNNWFQLNLFNLYWPKCYETSMSHSLQTVDWFDTIEIDIHVIFPY